MVEGIPIPQAERKRLLKQIEIAESYLKSRHIAHCTMNSNCITHCTTFALSDPNCDAQYMACSEEHTSICLDCLNIVQTLDEIKQSIGKISNEDLLAEVEYDFENAIEHTIEWFRHNVRAAQQDFEKPRIISKMGTDEAFCMSVLVGSFTWKTGARSTVANRTTTDIQSPNTFASESYILALTTAAQTELDTLSGGELILEQFKLDFPHIKRLHKRTDNAGNFSSHSTPEAERLICENLELELLTRDYSEVQKGKDICDRVCGVAKDRMRSWIATGNDLLSAYDIKEGMQYCGGIRNTKIATAEIIPGADHLDKTTIPNISLVRSVKYGSKAMKIYKASGIGNGISIKKNERQYYDLVLCPVNGCTDTFESDTELNAHIAANLHTIPEQVPRTANDIARTHLTEIVRTTRSRTRAKAAAQQQHSDDYDLSRSHCYEFLSICGWALRTRKLSNPMTQKVKDFLEEIWLDLIKTNSRIIPENIQQKIRAKRDQHGKKFFSTNENPSRNQINYQCRKFSQKYGITSKQRIIDEIVGQHQNS
ncbi:unnamed protein product [Adineta ricciae]|uniref:C2H2-type domain-containing protein n=1 Tax=Adineta ricciae TaxID=249248 RepID=A0A815R4B6_ADIRI|nr:unnamed protein product [Adineta ricciae]CAF1471977.1 unnamed protein product [Adineta ricciae]